ncbi:MAG: HNH endonuclease [Acidimicrobiales bacterium]
MSLWNPPMRAALDGIEMAVAGNSADNRIGEALHEAERSLDAALAASVAELSREELADVATQVESGLLSKVEALRARVVAEADWAGVGPVDGVRTVDQLVSARVGVDPARVRAAGRLGRWLVDFPGFEAAFAAGRMSREHLDYLRRADNIRVHQQMVDAQKLFEGFAATVDWRDWDEAVQYWLLGADPDGRKPSDQLRNRRFSIRRLVDGSFSGTFHLDPVGGQAARNALAIEVERLLTFDAENDVSRSAQDRIADAFVRLVMRGATRDNGDLPAPLVHIVMGEELAEELMESALSGETRQIIASHDDVNRRCEFADGTPIHPDMALAILAVARFRRLVLAPNSRPLELGRTCRGFPPDIRLALLVAARGRCRTAGCDAPFAWLQADHVEPWSKGGATDVVNGEPKCGADNRFKGNR